MGLICGRGQTHGLRTAFTPRLGAIKQPVLLVHGSRDVGVSAQTVAENFLMRGLSSSRAQSILSDQPAPWKFMDAQRLFPGPLSAVYETARHLVLALGDDVIEEFAKSQVSFGSARKFVWLTPLTKEGASTR